MNDLFHQISHRTSQILGSATTFLIVLTAVLIWFFSGPLFNFSENWQLFINTTTTVITFLMVFLIQNTQNRDSKAFHLKLDELIKSVKGARNSLVNIEELSDTELDHLQQEFRELQEKYLRKFNKRGKLKLVIEPHKVTGTTESTK